MPGPPTNLKIITRTEHTILIQWTRPEQTNSLSRYIIWANLLKKFGSKFLQPIPQWTIESNDNTLQYELLNLNPGKKKSFHLLQHIVLIK